MSPTEKLLTGWKRTKDVFLLFVVTLPFFFLPPDTLPITPGAGGVQMYLGIARTHCICLRPFHCSLPLEMSTGQDFLQST